MNRGKKIFLIAVLVVVVVIILSSLLMVQAGGAPSFVAPFGEVIDGLNGLEVGN